MQTMKGVFICLNGCFNVYDDYIIPDKMLTKCCDGLLSKVVECVAKMMAK